MVTNLTACVCTCSVGTSTCWSWTVPVLWTDHYTCSLSRTLLLSAHYDYLCNGLYISTLPITVVSYLLITEYTGGLNVFVLLFLDMPPKLVMFGKQFKPKMLNSQTGRMASYMNNMQWSPRYCPPHYYTNRNAMWQDTKQTELICSLSSWWMVSGSICPSQWHDSITQLQDADITSYCLNLMKNSGYQYNSHR